MMHQLREAECRILLRCVLTQTLRVVRIDGGLEHRDLARQLAQLFLVLLLLLGHLDLGLRRLLLQLLDLSG